MKKMIMTILAIVVFSAVLVGSTSAALIQGGIGLTGTYGFSPGTDLSTATTITFNSSFVLDATDDLAPALGLTAIMESPFVFDTFAGPVTLWTVNYNDGVAKEFTFTLNNLTIDDRSVDAIKLTGIGILGGTGFDDTDGNWVFTANKAGGSQTWSSSNAPIPEPATMILLGAGIVGLVGSRIRRKK